MKIILIILLFYQANCSVYSKSVDSTENKRIRLLNEIKNYDEIESWCLGYACNSISRVYIKSDSLMSLSTHEEVISYFQDTSYVLKYYAYLFILDTNDSIAFELLKTHINDSALVSTHFTSVKSSRKFNELLIDEYSSIIKLKYLFGGRVSIRGHLQYAYPPKDKRKWKKKSKQLKQLLKENHLEQEIR